MRLKTAVETVSRRRQRKEPEREQIDPATLTMTYPRFPSHTELIAQSQMHTAHTHMTLRGKIVLTILIISVACFGAYRWGGHKLVERVIPSRTVATMPAKPVHRVQWHGGETEENYQPSLKPPVAEGQQLQMGLMDDGTVVWRIKK
jgi:hypothetical protein